MNAIELENTTDVVEQHPADIAHTLESSPTSERIGLWETLSSEQHGEILPYLNGAIVSSLIGDKDIAEISQITESMSPSEIVEVIDAIPNELGNELLDSLHGLEKRRVEDSLSYAEDAVARILDYDVVTVTESRSVSQVLNYIRKHKLPEFTDMVFIVGRKQQLLGALTLSALLEASPELKVTELDTIAELSVLQIDSSQHEAALLFRQKYFVSLPVVDSDGYLLGRVTFDEVHDVINEEADHQIMGMAGLDEDIDLFAPVKESAKQRAVWLGINLMTAFLASWAIGLFSDTLEKVVALAVLMPVVASMGGIAGSQTLTLTIRGLALDQINLANRKAFLYKEVGVALINGVIWSIVVGIVTWLWFADITLACVISFSIFANLITAAGSGWLVPMVLNACRIDPAIAGSVVLTTVTDIVGFVLFLGLGTIWLL